MQIARKLKMPYATPKTPDEVFNLAREPITSRLEHLHEIAQDLSQQADRIIEEYRANGYKIPPIKLQLMRRSDRTAFRLVWLRTLSSHNRSGKKLVTTKEYQLKNYRTRSNFLGSIEEPALTYLLQIEKDAAEIRREVAQLSNVHRHLSIYKSAFGSGKESGWDQGGE